MYPETDGERANLLAEKLSSATPVSAERTFPRVFRICFQQSEDPYKNWTRKAVANQRINPPEV
jgi:hypothetical protein